MAIVIEDAEIERLVEGIARAKGIPVAEVVRQSLLSLADRRAVGIERAPLRERLAALAHEVDTLPARVSPDKRSDNEILGYDERGAW